MNKITITVEGKSCTGKSTISQQIAETLEAAGFPVTLSFINDEHDRRTTENQKVAIGRVLEVTEEIIINEKQLPRE